MNKREYIQSQLEQSKFNRENRGTWQGSAAHLEAAIDALADNATFTDYDSDPVAALKHIASIELSPTDQGNWLKAGEAKAIATWALAKMGKLGKP